MSNSFFNVGLDSCGNSSSLVTPTAGLSESLILTKTSTVYSVEVKEDSIEIVYRTPSNMVYANGKTAPDNARKCVYGFEGGKVVLLSESFGQIHHQETIIVPERLEMREPLK